jgi:hypothetical protein
MRKENIFLVTLQSATAAVSGPAINQVVICAQDEEAMHDYVRQAFPACLLLGAASMLELEATLVGLKDALACNPGAHAVYVDPKMRSNKAPTQH